MKRVTVFVLILASLLPLSARPRLVLDLGTAQGEVAAMVGGTVERVAEHSLLSRMEGEGSLSISLDDYLLTEPYDLRLGLMVSYGEKSLPLQVSLHAQSLGALEKGLERKLSLLLLYDGLLFVEEDEALRLGSSYNQGYASSDPLGKGEYYQVLDAEAKRWGSVVVQQVGAVSILAQTEGKELLPSMRLKRMEGRAVSLSLLVSQTRDLFFDALYEQEVGLYPFTFLVGVGTSPVGLHAQTGLAVRLPLSLLFGIHHGVWRNSSLSASCTLGLGYALSDSQLLLGSRVVVSYQYRIGDLRLEGGVGNQNWASEHSSFGSGLFLMLGTAYTW